MLSVTIGAVNQTAFLQEGTGTLKYNTLDIVLLNPATVPALGDTVTLTDPTWSGTVTRISRRTGPRPGYKYVTVSATNEDVAGASAGPFSLTETPTGQSYYQAIIDSAPVAYWRLGEASGTAAADAMAAYAGTYVGTPTLGAAGALSGDANTAVTFASTKYVTCGTTADIGAGDATFMAWIKTTDTTTDGRIISKRNAGAAWDFAMSAIGGGVSGLTLFVDDGAGHSGANSIAVQVNDGSWHHVVGVREGTTIKVYVDGVASIPGTVSLLGSIANANTCLIGELQLVTRPFIGTIDEPAIWSRALSATEIAAIYATRAAAGPVPTYGYDSLTVETSDNLDATSTTKGTCTIYQTGLWPAMTFLLTSADLGYAATSFSVRDVTVTWVKGVPRYHLSFGDPLVTMSVWLNSASAGILPITTTKITDDAVTTPKIASGSVTTGHLAVGAATSFIPIDHSNLVVNGSFEELVTGAVVAAYQAASSFKGWTAFSGQTNAALTSTTVKHGQYIAALKGDGATANPSIVQYVPVRAGRKYRLSGWLWKSAATGTNVQVLAHSYDKAGTLVTSNVLVLDLAATTTPTFKEATWTCPAGSASVRVTLRGAGTPANTEVFAFEDVKLEEVPSDLLNSAGTVVITSTGVTVTNGALTLTNAGSTVIIDGTSNMFKIQATGTLSATESTGDGTATAIATLSGLGALATIPAFLAFVGNSNTVGNARIIGRSWLVTAAEAYSAATSGGAVTRKIVDVQGWIIAACVLDGSNYAVPTLQVFNKTGSSVTGYQTYHVLKEIAL